MWHATTNFQEVVPVFKAWGVSWRQCGDDTATHRPRILPHRPDKYSANRNTETWSPPAYLIGGNHSNQVLGASLVANFLELN